MLTQITRFARIERVMVKYGLEQFFLKDTSVYGLQYLFLLSPTRWMSSETRNLPRGVRIRLALEELGPVFVKLGQVMSTRRDLLPDDIGEELTLLQDKVKPFSSIQARQEIEDALDEPIDVLFKHFEDKPIASASIAQVHGIELHDGTQAVVKVLRPNIRNTITRDVKLMYLLADIAARVLQDGKRLRPREVVAEFDRTIHNELDLVSEATNAVVLRNNFKDSSQLYIPEIYWEYTRSTVMVQERIFGVSIREVDELIALGVDMKTLAENGVEIFYTQVFEHNFFHADMHPGNIFVSPENPEKAQYIAVDFGIVGSLTEEDQRYVGENLLAFLQRDYRKVAQLHIDSGWVPRDTRVSELEAGVRAVCEPIFDKPLSEISFGDVLLQLFHVARRFNMEVQPQLVLLQKTLLNIEGLGRQLYPELDIWATSKPFLQNWVLKKNNPRQIFKQLMAQAPTLLRVLPDMPMMLHDYVQLRNRLMAHDLDTIPHGMGLRSQQSKRSDSRLRNCVTGGALIVAASLLASAQIIAGYSQISGWIGILGVIGCVFCWFGARKH